MAGMWNCFVIVLNEMLDSESEALHLWREITEQSEILTVVMKMDEKRADIPRVTIYMEEVGSRLLTEDYITHNRISYEMFNEILYMLRDSLIYEHNGGSDQCTPEKQLFMFLCYMANTETMREIGHYFGVGKSTVHITIVRVLRSFVTKFIHVMKWPDHQQQDDIARDNQLKYGLPDVVGCLDGTHIRLAYCPQSDRDYIYRKNFPSMQLQVVVDNKMFITDAYTGWPGSTHDARVLRNSSLFEKGENRELTAQNKIVAADSAYPVKQWLITPFRDNGHLNADQRRFNRVFSSCRVTVERAIGHLKGRFRRLTYITVHRASNIALTIMSGCILHNLCIWNHEDVEQYAIPDDGDNHPNQFINIYRENIDGVQRRLQLMRQLP